jgi:glycosyltransferase involved in cell wall biosynthesis
MESKLTILIPTWNRKKYLEALLNVLLPQFLKHPDVDLIISSNGSTDGTVEYLETLCNTPRTIIIHQPVNLGAHIHLGWLYGQARGEYLWMIGDDDLVEPDTLDIVCQTLHANLKIGWLHLPGTFYIKNIHAAPPTLHSTKCPPQDVRVEKARTLFAEYNHWNSWVSSNVIATQLLQQELPRLKLSTSWWPWQLLMKSVANHPAIILASTEIIGGENITWMAEKDIIVIVELPQMLLESDFLTVREKRDLFYVLYHDYYPINFARLLNRAPCIAWRIILICPALLNWRIFRAFAKVIAIKYFRQRKNGNALTQK